MRHITHSCGAIGQTWIYIYQRYEVGHRCVHLCWKFKIKRIRLLVLVHLISIHSYINSLRHVSHHHIICTHYHLLVDTNVPYDGLLSGQEFPMRQTITLPDDNIMLHRRVRMACCHGLFDKSFYLNREGLEWKISGTIKFALYR